MVWLSPIRRLRNTKRTVFKKKFDYVYVEFPDHPQPNRRPKPLPFLARMILPTPRFSVEWFETWLTHYGKSKRGKGLVLELPPFVELSLGSMQQLRRSLLDFQATGKEVVFISKSYTTRSYALASMADKVLLLPTGWLDTRGYDRTVTFVRNGLDKLGLQFEKVAISGYKSAGDNFARSDMAPEARENLEWLAREEMLVLEGLVTKGRRLTGDQFTTLVNNSPMLDHQALELGYVDDLTRPEELPEYLGSEDKPARFLYFQKLSSALPIPKKTSRKRMVGLITVSGTIVDGESQTRPVPFPDTPLMPNVQAGDKTVVQLARKVRKNPHYVGAILFVDSPGGSVTASEEMRAALQKLASVKPLVTYFNGVAASGGYYIATASPYIISEPGCVTGSIGVLNGRINWAKLMEDRQLTAVHITEGDHATWGSPDLPMNEDERLHLKKSVEHIYDRFLGYVADARGMTKEAVDRVAGGRVWLGTQALGHGLVDALGSLPDAMAKVCSLANVDPTKTPLVTVQPPSRPTYPPFGGEKNLVGTYLAQARSLTHSQMWLLDPSLFQVRE